MRDYYRQALKVSWVSVTVNFVIFLIKIIVGVLSNSIAILSDAIHSLGDLFTTGAVIVSLHVSKKPSDKEHPFGHGRAEDIAGLLLAFFIGGT